MAVLVSLKNIMALEATVMVLETTVSKLMHEKEHLRDEVIPVKVLCLTYYSSSIIEKYIINQAIILLNHKISCRSLIPELFWLSLIDG